VLISDGLSDVDRTHVFEHGLQLLDLRRRVSKRVDLRHLRSFRGREAADREGRGRASPSRTILGFQSFPAHQADLWE